MRRVPVVAAGAGLGGLAFAADLATRGVQCLLLLDDDDTVGVRGASSRGRSARLLAGLTAGPITGPITGPIAGPVLDLCADNSTHNGLCDDL